MIYLTGLIKILFEASKFIGMDYVYLFSLYYLSGRWLTKPIDTVSLHIQVVVLSIVWS